MNACKIEACQQPVKARGWCRKHYLRWWTHGDPNVLLSHSTERGPLKERFWRLVEKSDPSSCWMWTGKKGSKGYGLAHIDGGRQAQAHRVAYELLNGPIPDGMEIDHTCNVRPCVNPNHLEPVTHAENVRRRFRRAQKAG